LHFGIFSPCDFDSRGLGLGRRRNRAVRKEILIDLVGIEKLALDWRDRLNISGQFAPDIHGIYETSPECFPNITFKTFDVAEFPSMRTVAWAHAGDRIVEMRADRKQALKRANADARWDAVHELAHVALNHAGNNLFWANGYSVEDSRREKEAEAFTFSFLAPVHLAKTLATVDDYVARFRIPYLKAKARKQQVDLIVSQISRVELLPSNSTLTVTKTLAIPADHTIAKPSLIKPQQLEFSFSKSAPRPKKSTSNENLQLPSSNSLKAVQDFLEFTKASIPSPLTVLALEDREILEKLLSDTNSKVSNFRVFVKWGVGISVFGIGSLPVVTEVVDSAVKPLVIGASGIVGGAFAFFQILDRPVGLEARLERWARRKLLEEARNRGISKKIEKHSIVFRNGSLQLQD
jgi:hypothetical protein